MKKILVLFTLWRILLFLPVVLGAFWLAQRPGYHYTLVPFFTKTFNPINHFLLSPWGNFDGIYYLFIASRGYTVEAGFFPLLPLLIRAVSFLFGGFLAFDPRQYLLANIVVNLAFFGALWVLYRLIQLDYKKDIAWRSLVLLISFPTAFFFIAIYSEALFLLLALMAFLCARKRQWFLAGFFGALLSATRFVGIAILPALLVEWYAAEWKNKKHTWRTLTRLVAIFVSALGLLAYAWFNVKKWGSAFYFIQAQGSFLNNRSVNNLVNPLQTLFRYAKIFVSVPIGQYEWWVAALEVASFVCAAALLVIAWKKNVRVSYLVFALGCFLTPVLTGTFTGLPRYIVVLFPMFVAASTVLKRRALFYGVVFFSVILEAVLLALFSRGYFVA